MLGPDLTQFRTEKVDLVFKLRDLAPQFFNGFLVNLQKNPDTIIDYRCQRRLAADHRGDNCGYRADERTDNACAQRHPNRTSQVSFLSTANNLEEMPLHTIARHFGDDRFRAQGTKNRFNPDPENVLRRLFVASVRRDAQTAN